MKYIGGIFPALNKIPTTEEWVWDGDFFYGTFFGTLPYVISVQKDGKGWILTLHGEVSTSQGEINDPVFNLTPIPITGSVGDKHLRLIKGEIEYALRQILEKEIRADLLLQFLNYVSAIR